MNLGSPTIQEEQGWYGTIELGVTAEPVSWFQIYGSVFTDP